MPGGVIELASARAGVSIHAFVHETPGAFATALLLPGGAGAIGRSGDDGWPRGINFLVRAAPHFAAEGLNVVLLAPPSDTPDMTNAFRLTPAHLDDLRRLIVHARERFAAPLWLVGTSRGTISAAAAAIALRGTALVDGVVFTSSVTGAHRIGALPMQALERIDVPALVMHHARDGCAVCSPREAPGVYAGLANAPVRRLLIVEGGEGARGNPCGPLHHHGFVGMEAEAVNAIARWMHAPAAD